MKILLKDEYKSLKPFESEDLNEFTIITGKNGSGKSQLLDLIYKKSNNYAETSHIKFLTDEEIYKVKSEGLVKSKLNSINDQTWKNKLQQYINRFNELPLEGRILIDIILESDLRHLIKTPNRNLFLIEDSYYKNLIHKTYIFFHSPSNNRAVTISDEHIVLSKIFSDSKFIDFIEAIAFYNEKKVENINHTDFYNTPIEEHFIDDNELFSSEIEMIFYNYSKRRDLNRKLYFYKKEDGDINNSIPDVQFIEKFIPPWVLINNIFQEHNLDFYFKDIHRQEFSVDVAIQIKLYKKSTNQLIPFEDISSGEKIIIGLIIKLFTSSYYGDRMSFPDILILDEPDAHLHPEMSKLLLDVLENTFVKKYGVKVIISTHSPSTIALAPEECIYELKNGIESSLKKVSKDNALKILTSFIPTLSINYKNHRQVFVESPTDVDYYQVLHDKYLQTNTQSSKLYFIANGYGKGNCEHVYKIVKSMRNSGNKTSFGIADWDLKNENKDFTFVHGKDERYSVENFILDPIYLIVLLMEMDAQNIFSEISFDKGYNLYSIGNETEDQLQELIKYFFEKFESQFPAFKYESEKKTVTYHNSKSIKIPLWYLTTKGHHIEVKIKQIFPALAGKYRNEGDLQKALSVIMARCYPFVPISSIEIIDRILSHE